MALDWRALRLVVAESAVDNTSDDAGRWLEPNAPGLRLSPENAPVAITGQCDWRIACLAIWLLQRGFQVALVPELENVAVLDFSCSAVLVVNADRVAVYPARGVGPRLCGDWRIAMLTSGSTGRPKTVLYGEGQLAVTVEWYRKIYGLDRRDLLINPLPATYNFGFVAGVLAPAITGTRVAFGKIGAEAPFTDTTVAIANPRVVESLALRRAGGGMLVDCGGAPISVSWIGRLRDAGFDLREGYGLTETCSLTHFDADGDTAALGTVGRPMAEVRQEIVSGEHPLLELHSPNASPILGSDSTPDGSIRTGDLASIDGQGRLRLLGRTGDHPIGGRWPRDTLDLVGDILAGPCATVQHSEMGVIIRYVKAISKAQQLTLIGRVSEALRVSPRNVNVGRTLVRLHSGKIPRLNLTHSSSTPS